LSFVTDVEHICQAVVLNVDEEREPVMVRLVLQPHPVAPMYGT
jgi:hypothetical protein